MTLVDIGAGTGQFATAFSDWFDIAVVAVEPSAAMRERIPRSPAIDPRQGDATALPLADASADAAWLSLVIHHIPDLEAAAREIQRVSVRRRPSSSARASRADWPCQLGAGSPRPPAWSTRTRRLRIRRRVRGRRISPGGSRARPRDLLGEPFRPPRPAGHPPRRRHHDALAHRRSVPARERTCSPRRARRHGHRAEKQLARPAGPARPLGKRLGGWAGRAMEHAPAVGVELVARDETGPNPAGHRSQLSLADEGAHVVLGAVEFQRDVSNRQALRFLHARSIALRTARRR